MRKKSKTQMAKKNVTAAASAVETKAAETVQVAEEKKEVAAKAAETKVTEVKEAVETKAAETASAVASAATEAKNAVETKAKEATTEVKKTVKKAKAAVKKTAESKEMEKKIVVQYQNMDTNFDIIEDRVKAQFVAEGHRAGTIKKLDIYIKPEDYAAYYVINEKFSGRVDLF